MTSTEENRDEVLKTTPDALQEQALSTRLAASGRRRRFAPPNETAAIPAAAST